MKVWPLKSKARRSFNFLLLFCEARGPRSQKSLLQVTNMPPVEIQEFPFQARDNYQQNRRRHSSTKLNKVSQRSSSASTFNRNDNIEKQLCSQSPQMAQLPVHWGN